MDLSLFDDKNVVMIQGFKGKTNHVLHCWRAAEHMWAINELVWYDD